MDVSKFNMMTMKNENDSKMEVMKLGKIWKGCKKIPTKIIWIWGS
jgi:hypothetical protein